MKRNFALINRHYFGDFKKKKKKTVTVIVKP